MRTPYTIFLDGDQDPQDPQDPYGTREELDQTSHQISRITSTLRFATLQPGEIQILGGALFPDAPTMVRFVARALIDYPEVFPDIRISGHDLLMRLGQAEALGDLEDQLQWLAQHLGATKHKVLGNVVIDAQTVLKAVQTSAAQGQPYLGAAPDAARRRELAMSPAQQRVDAYRDSLQKIKRRLKKLRTLKAGKPAAKKKPSPQKLRAQRQARARALSEVYGAFDSCMRHWHRNTQRAKHVR